ncbi:MAG TPA: nucleoside deaminase [Acidimicrobiales bacterium]|nr:nucleoside deaminase [Acidimicrobiales bacterium]
MNALEAWSSLSLPWQACVEEAWTSWSRGSAGVGCVITDADGSIVVRAGNRRHEQKASPYDLADTPIAHAEMVALATLRAGSYVDHTLYTSFEPCLMCASTILVTGIGHVSFAAADPLFDGMHDWFADLPWAANRRPERSMLGGPVGAFCHVLHLSWLAFWVSEGPVIDAHSRLSPRALDAARAISREGHLAPIAADGGSAVDALAAVWGYVFES